MKKKLSLRIQAFVLILLLILTTFVITPQKTLADTEATADEEEIKKLEAEQVAEDAIADETEDQESDVEMPDPAERDIGTRAAYTDEKYFEFDPMTGTITGYRYDGPKVVNIPPYINDVKVEHIGFSAFENYRLTSVTIPNGIKKIGDHAFRDNRLENVTIPNSVIEIGTHVFFNNRLKTVKLPDNITEIAVNTFTGNYLTEVKIPNSVQSIQALAFSHNRLTSITIPNSVRFIGYCAFDKNNLTNVTIPDSVMNIGEKAFSINPISRATIPEGIRFIMDMTGNELVYLPTIEQVGEHCFDEGVSLIGKHYIKAKSIIRETPNGKEITRLWRPLYVTGTSTSQGKWLKFTYGGKPAYVAMIATSTNSPPMIGYAKQTLNIRSTPNGSIIGKIPIGRKVNGILVGNMVVTTYNGINGYVYASLLQKNPVKVTRYLVANSIIRSKPNGSVIARPWRPLRVSGTIQGAWLKFTYGGKTAYVAMVSTRTKNPPMTGYAKQTLNIRNTPSGSIIGRIPIGRQVKGVLVGNMVKTTYNGKTGYVYASLLQKNRVRVTRYIVTNAIIRSRPNGSIITRLSYPIRVSGTIQGAWLKFTYNKKTAYVAMVSTRTSYPR